MEMMNMIIRNNYEGEQDEKDKEINDLFQIERKRKRNERNHTKIPLSVMNVMIEFKIAAQEDCDLNRQEKPDINKLKKLSLFTDVLSEYVMDLEHHDKKEHLKNSGIGNVKLEKSFSPEPQPVSAFIIFLSSFVFQFNHNKREKETYRTHLDLLCMRPRQHHLHPQLHFPRLAVSVELDVILALHLFQGEEEENDGVMVAEMLGES
ncbi:hypothetical protein V8G54_037824 [Vigna mungo]|uniref:Uncharacterized protein n=1 Tax=Vigna mungo TaxID=3915 RepID=A0AAQ3MK15_VIGMU